MEGYATMRIRGEEDKTNQEEKREAVALGFQNCELKIRIVKIVFYSNVNY